MDQFLAELEPRQFDEWRALHAIEPWGEERADYRTALLATAIETLAREEPIWRLGDFLPFVLDHVDQPEDDAVEVMPAELQVELWRAMADRFRR